MKFNSLSIIFVFMILFILLIICIKINKNNELFITQNNDPANDGKMKFGYLTDKDYNKNILNMYYLNDDTRINGMNIVNHPYQKKINKIFGIAPNLNMTSKDSNDIYSSTGIRL
jgi:hypothetical protein